MKKKRICGVALVLALGCGSLLLSGCPRSVQLEITPASIVFSENQVERRLTLSNLGARSVEWTMETLVRTSAEAEWTEAPIDWLQANKNSGRLAPGVEHITLVVDRSSLQPGTYSDVALRISARNFEKVVPLSLVVSPLLVASPQLVTLQANALSAQFRLENRGQAAVMWAAQYFDGNDPSVAATELPPDMILTPNGGALARQSAVTVQMDWTQPRADFGLRIYIPGSSGHDAVVLFRFGTPLTELVVDPETLTLFYSPLSAADGVSQAQPPSTLSLRNVGRRTLQWTVTLRARGEAIDQTVLPVAAEITSGSLPAGETASVIVRVIDPKEALPGAGNYELAVQVLDRDGVLTVPLVLEAVSLPIVIASDPPDENAISYTLKRTLDLGRTETQGEFWVVNIGPLDSRLYFRIRHTDEGVEKPLIVDVRPMTGDTNGPDGVFAIGEGRYVDARRVVITVDRTAMTEDVEYRDIFIEAWDEDGLARIDAVPPWQIQLRVERPPMTVQGAINRSRPPFLMRFVFALRDTLGRVIPTRTEEDLSRLNFVISENDDPIDLNEVNFGVEGPEQLKVNMVVMLDYTGSLYYAGVNNPESPKRPGEVLDQIREAVALFLDDLPPSYRVALMYHNDRQPLNRLIHPFSTDRESLKAALRNFYVPPQMHGTSDIFDALTDAVNRVIGEDAADTLPFDDADVRAVLFITDGHDNSSEGSAPGSIAKTNRVRLYPLAYTADLPTNFVNLVPLAQETGGHFYNAGNPENLARLLGYKRSLALVPSPFDPKGTTAEFKIRNVGGSTINWTVIENEGYDWLQPVVPASGSTPAGGESLITVNVNPGELTGWDNVEGRGLLNVQSNDGNGEVQISLALEDDRVTVQNLALSLRDEPGQIWEDMQNQVVLTYVTPSQGSGNYSIRIDYAQPDAGTVSGFFKESGVFYSGDVRAGQISLSTTGINRNYAAQTDADFATAVVYVRADYVPRLVNLFRMRFVPVLADNLPTEVADAFWDNYAMKVELAPQGLLVFDSDDDRPNWRLVPENDGIYRLLTPREYALEYASSGDLLRITLSNLWPFVEASEAAGLEPELFLDMRLDNAMYFAPATPNRPSETVYFLYPSGPLNPDRLLRISDAADLAGPSKTVVGLAFPEINPEAAGVWDRDNDGLPDFVDPLPDDDSVPGRLTRPSVVRFVPGTLSLPVSIINNRWDRFTWSARIVTPVGSSLRPEQFLWYYVDNNVQTPLNAGETPAGELGPGDERLLVLEFVPEELQPGIYPAQIILDTDVFGSEITPIEVQP